MAINLSENHTKLKNSDNTLYVPKLLQQKRYLNLERKLLLFSTKLSNSCSRVQYINLSYNDIGHRSLDFLVDMPILVKIDLSYCNMHTVPKQQVIKQLKELKVLYLHNNLITDALELENLGVATALVYLTLFNNPIQTIFGIRHMLATKISTLRALNFNVFADSDYSHTPMTIEQEEEVLNNPKTRLDWPTYSAINFNLTETKIVKAIFEQELAAINRLFLRNSGIVRIQRVYRGYRVRRRNTLIKLVREREQEKSIQNRILSLGLAWKRKAHYLGFIRQVLQERNKEDYMLTMIDIRKRKANYLVLQFISNLKNRLNQRRIVARVRQIMITSYNNLYALHKAPDLFFHITKNKRIFILSRQQELFKQAIEKCSTLVCRIRNQYTRENVLDVLSKHTKKLEGWRVFRAFQCKKDMRTLSILQLIRMNTDLVLRKSNTNTFDRMQQRIRTLEIKRKTHFTLNNSQRRQVQETNTKISKLAYSYENTLLAIEPPDPMLLYILVKQILAENRMQKNNANAIALYFDIGIQRVAAAVTIQAWYRRHRALRYSPSKNIITLIRRHRAAIIVQRWFRNFKFRYRIFFLESLNQYLGRILDSTMYLEEEVYTKLNSVIHVKSLMMIDQSIKILVNMKDSMFIATKYNRILKINLPVLPNWLKATSIPTMAMGMEDYQVGDLMNTLHLNTSIKRKIKLERKYYKITFQNVQHARQVAAVLAIQTFRYAHCGCFIRFIRRDFFKIKGEKGLQRYHSELAKIYGIKLLPIPTIEQKDRYSNLNNPEYINKTMLNAGLIISNSSMDLRERAKAICPSHIYNIRVHPISKVDTSRPSSAALSPKKERSNIIETEDYIHFVPLVHFKTPNVLLKLTDDYFIALKPLTEERSPSGFNRSFYRTRDNLASAFSPLRKLTRKRSLPGERCSDSPTREQLFLEIKEDDAKIKKEQYHRMKQEARKNEAMRIVAQEEDTAQKKGLAVQKRMMKQIIQNNRIDENELHRIEKIKEFKREKEKQQLLINQAAEAVIDSNKKQTDARKLESAQIKSMNASYRPIIKKIHQNTNLIIRSEMRGMIRKIKDEEREEIANKVQKQRAQSAAKKEALRKTLECMHPRDLSRNRRVPNEVSLNEGLNRTEHHIEVQSTVLDLSINQKDYSLDGDYRIDTRSRSRPRPTPMITPTEMKAAKPLRSFMIDGTNGLINIPKSTIRPHESGIYSKEQQPSFEDFLKDRKIVESKKIRGESAHNTRINQSYEAALPKINSREVSRSRKLY